MSHKYTNYSKMKEKNVEEELPVEQVIEENSLEDSKATEDFKPDIGYVINCDRLRVRKLPNPNARVLCELMVGTNVVIDLEHSTVGYYKVYTESGVEGYCMKHYIAMT